LEEFRRHRHLDAGVLLEDEAKRWTVPARWNRLGETPGAAAGPAPTVPMAAAEGMTEDGLHTKQAGGLM
jgi:hypothetical protein